MKSWPSVLNTSVTRKPALWVRKAEAERRIKALTKQSDGWRKRALMWRKIMIEKGWD